MDNDHHNNNNNGSSSSSSPHGMTMMSSRSPSEAFSECMSHLLMSTEELRRSCIQATTTAAATRPSSIHSANVKILIQPDQVFAWQHGLEHSILPLLDQLARWTADIANPTSMEADLFQHCQGKAMAVAQIVLETAIKYFSESALVDPMETDGEPMEQVLRNVQGSIARITELCLVLIAGNDILTCGSSSAADDDATVNDDQSQKARQQQKLDAIKAIVQSYVSYQRQVLRQRCRPVIAKLVQIRKQQQQQQQQQQQTTPLHHHQHHHHDDDTDDEDNDQPRVVVVEQHHAAALTVILGQAAALIHPLIVWKMTLQQQIQQQQQHHGGDDVNSASIITATALYRLCTESISTLDEQTCTLTKTVSDWFHQDRPVDAYMQKCATEENSIPQAELCVLDGLVEEMAYTCQVLARYQALLAAAAAASSSSPTSTSATSKSNDNNNNNHDTDNPSSSSSLHAWIYESLHLPQTLDVVIERELIPEWTWKYAALERFLAVQQWQSALIIAAQPVQIVIGTRIFVPSIVEDAQYLSTRALERAASTRSTLAIGTVAHAVSRDVWSTTEGLTTSGVHQALLQERGCWAAAASLSEQDESGEGGAAAAKKKNALGDSSSNDFAAALLDALDEDLGSKQHHHSSTSPPHSSKTQPQPRHPSAPTSGGFLTSTLLAVGGGGSSGTNPTDQVFLETRFCVLNGVHAAAGACRSLVEFLDTLLLDEADDSPAAAALQQPNNTGSSGIHGNDQATAMIHLAREELFRYAKDYDKLLSDRFQDTLTTWCGDGGTGHAPSVSRSRRKLCFDELRAFLEGENYNIDAGAMKKAEADERLEHGVVGPLKESLLLQQLSDRCESDVLCQLGQVMVATVVDIVLDCLWSTEKKMTDWGSLLLSKQVRLLQGTFSKILAQDLADASVLPSSSGAAPNSIQQWERLSQVCNVLQLEQPAEWLMYLDSSVLSAEELKKTMSLRVDFSRDAIQKVVATAKQRMEELQATRVTT